MQSRLEAATLGQVRRERDLGWVSVLDVVHRPGLVLDLHEHRYPALTLVRRGAFRVRVTGTDYDCTPAGILFKQGEEPLLRDTRVEPGPPPGWLRECVAILHEELDAALSLGGLSSRVDVSRSRLARAFRRHHGCSVGAYLRRLRVEHAARRLRESDAPLASIALEAGFYDHAHFCRMFRRHLGVTPGGYRASAGTPQNFKPTPRM